MAMLEARPYRPFKSSEEYLEAMKEDLAEWLSTLYPELSINAENFMDRLDTGVALCKHANYVRQAAEDYLARRQARNKSMTRSMTSGLAGPILALGNVHYLPAAKSGTFFARDNVSNFITWCRKSLKIIECLLFETDDLIMRKNEKHVILCLLEVARRGAKFGMLAPMLVQMERQIDREIAADNKANGVGSSESGTQTEAINSGNSTATTTTITTITVETDLYDDSDDSETEDDGDENPVLMYGPQPQIITNDLKSLDEMVRDLVEKCTCPSQFPMVRVSEGKYRIGDTKVLIFVRILRSHVMVRVGGGWDTLSHYLDKHDPCRCRAQHRSSVAARLVPRQSPNHNPSNGIELHKAQVIFERSPPAARRVFNSPNYNGGSGTGTGTVTGMGAGSSATGTGALGVAPPPPIQNGHSLSPNSGKYRSRSPTPQRKFLNQQTNGGGSAFATGSGQTTGTTESSSGQLLGSPSLARRSMSPSPRRLIDMRKKQSSLDSYSSGPKSLPGYSCSLEEATAGGGGAGVPVGSAAGMAGTGNGGGSGQSAEQGGANKFENISDNGSEISDEGYRSLGVIQSGAQKRESLHSQASIEDAEGNARLDQTSSDSQISPSDEPAEKTAVDILEEQDLSSQDREDEHEDYSVCDGPQSLPAILSGGAHKLNDKFEQSGVFITDDEITVDMVTKAEDASVTPVAGIPTPNLSKIPRSPLAQRRRRSIDNSTCGGAGGSLQDLTSRSGLPAPAAFSRKQPVYRSVRTRNSTGATTNTPTPMAPPRSRQATQLPMVRDVTNTWSGRATGAPKRRPPCNADTFVAPTNGQGLGAGSFERNGKGRSSQILYDSNGRRVRSGAPGCTSSLTTSPVKNHASSPLAQQLLEAASSAKNDTQILEKMKSLLSRYAAGNQAKAGATANKINSNGKKTPVYEDFTTAWVHSNGNLERSESCSPPAKARSKRSSAASSIESNNSNVGAGAGGTGGAGGAGAGAGGAGSSSVVSPRRERGMSKIPAPVRHHTELY
ncbi:GAS2-like protein pickled eggs isoform X1 [Drosophila gunungcola]|uniref:GAS2-like protein pickled eggs isoform X1 n=2 Tax=Drosophila gunungcola TaxID=103775 RepID=UPI0022E87837|nr:GAS2-like protein pickled eggs isoform X1 [Drosophila gunungcola]XP_052857243.1 GAS2-like protein pickled eggs isoform X1 [Drosophila gunungcola]